MTVDEKHDQLVASAARSERELREALRDLRHAVDRFRPGERIRRQPLPWMFSSLLLGVWLGSRK